MEFQHCIRLKIYECAFPNVIKLMSGAFIIADNINIDLPVYATTAGTAGYVTIAKGATSTPTAIGSQFVSGSTSSTSVDIIRLRVPAGWYYEFTESGVTFGTASVFAE